MHGRGREALSSALARASARHGKTGGASAQADPGRPESGAKNGADRAYCVSHVHALGLAGLGVTAAEPTPAIFLAGRRKPKEI